MRITTSGMKITTQNPANRNASPPKRTKNKGWTKHAALRNRDFLYSIIPESLSGYGYAVTLTIDQCPSPELWALWSKKFFKYVGRSYDLTRYHWVNEWQRRGQPHLHSAVWFDGQVGSDSRVQNAINMQHIKNIWLKVAKDGNPNYYAQDMKPMDDQYHWLKYLAKHGVRGVQNYQRHSDNIPEAWQGNTGRVWGKGGDFKTMPFLRIEGLQAWEKYEIRRLFCRYLASNPAHLRIKAENQNKNAIFWNNYLKRCKPEYSRLRGASSFIPLDVQAKIVKWVNPEADFYNEDTGEVYSTIADVIGLKNELTGPIWSPPPVVVNPLSDFA